MEHTIRLGGRDFAGVAQDITAAQENYITGHLRRSGAQDCLVDESLTNEQRAEEMLTRVLVSGETFHVLAGCLTETGKQWSQREAERNAAFFAGLKDRESKDVIRQQLIFFVIGFLGFAGKSAPTSPRSSIPSEEGRVTSSGAPAISETSVESSAPSQDSTVTVSAG